VLHTEQLGDILISDTVGFIRKLPHHLVDAFRSTLEELVYADVLVHVVDASDPQWRLQAEVVEELCRQLGAEKTPRLLVFNKVDLLRDDQLPRETGAIYTAASKGIGLENLVNNICRILGEDLKTVKFILPYSQAGVLDKLYREANVKKAEYVETGIDIEAVVDQKTYGRIRDLLPEDQREPDHEEF
jgi:GTP-binding protein HflX